MTMTRFELATLTLARRFGQLCYLRLRAKKYLLGGLLPLADSHRFSWSLDVSRPGRGLISAKQVGPAGFDELVSMVWPDRRQIPPSRDTQPNDVTEPAQFILLEGVS